MKIPMNDDDALRLALALSVAFTGARPQPESFDLDDPVEAIWLAEPQRQWRLREKAIARAGWHPEIAGCPKAFSA